MDKRLQGKTILITGASLRVLQPGGVKLVLTARRLDVLEQIAADLAAQFPNTKVLPVQLDVSSSAAVRSFVGSLPAAFQEIDVLVNNAGLVRGVDKAPAIKEEDLDVRFANNIHGLIHMTQAVLPRMLARNGGAGAGDIVNIGSIAGREPYVGGGIYCATKAAVRSFTESLRKELTATRVRVIGVDPGQVETEFSIVRFYGDKAKADAVYAGCDPLTPEDVAESIVFAVGRRENVVVADTLLFPNHQASATIMHRRSA
ncbi:hypothetical protein SCUCBS95973_001202 [Sporothrix curviconia]|uniref:Oxidoreductase n=1 Tax=Sporothrix curviconia TaxID=1260050 RepID=A0ABP0AWP2_9PEZI